MKLAEFIAALEHEFPGQVRMMTLFEHLPVASKTEDIRLFVDRGQAYKIVFLYFYTESAGFDNTHFIYLPAKTNFPLLMQFIAALEIDIEFGSPDA